MTIPSYGSINHNSVTLIFRYDDYSSKSATYLDEKVIDLFKKYHIAFTVGVIPYVASGVIQNPRPQDVIVLSQPKVDMLLNAIHAGTLNVALHGYSHHNINRSFLNKPTEFAGLDYDSQFLKIREGKLFLEKTLGVSIDTFIPPFGTYDANTLLALEKMNFLCLSSNLSGYASPSATLKFLPNTCELGQLRKVLSYAQRISYSQPIVCVVFHEYDFSEINYEVSDGTMQLTFQDFEALIKWITLQKDIEIKTIDQVIKEQVDLSAGRFINNKYYIRLAHLKPAFWPPHYGYYLPSANAYDLRIRNIFINYNIDRLLNILLVASFYGIIMAAFGLMSWIAGFIFFKLISMPPFIYYFIKYGNYLLILLMMIYGIFVTQIHYRVLIPLVSLLGILMGFWVSFPKI